MTTFYSSLNLESVIQNLTKVVSGSKTLQQTWNKIELLGAECIWLKGYQSKRQICRKEIQSYLQWCQVVAIGQHRSGYLSQFVAGQIPRRTTRSCFSQLINTVSMYLKLISQGLTVRKHPVTGRGVVGGSSSGCACLPAVCISLRFSFVKLPGCTVKRMLRSFPFRRLLLVTPARYTAAVQQHRSWSPSHGALLWIKNKCTAK